MKPILLFCIIGGLLSGVVHSTPTIPPIAPEAAQRPSPEDLLAKAVQSIGGRKQLNRLESFQMHGVLRLPDERPIVEVELTTQKGGKVLGIMTYISVGQTRFGSDGTTAWEQNINTDKELTWAIIEPSVLSQKVQQMNWLEWFTMLPSQLSDMTVVGDEEFDDESCWKIEIKDENGKDQFAFFSKLTHRPKGRRTIEKTSNGDATVDVYFRDWVRVDDLLLFHSVTYSREDRLITLTLDRIVLNKNLNINTPTFFDLPEQIIQLRDNK